MKTATLQQALSVFMLFFLLFALVIASCANPGSEYLGSWENTKNPQEQLEITRNGDSFLIKATNGALMTTAPATLRDGVLEVHSALGASFTYVKATGTLLLPGLSPVEYRRSK